MTKQLYKVDIDQSQCGLIGHTVELELEPHKSGIIVKFIERASAGKASVITDILALDVSIVHHGTVLINKFPSSGSNLIEQIRLQPVKPELLTGREAIDGLFSGKYCRLFKKSEPVTLDHGILCYDNISKSRFLLTKYEWDDKIWTAELTNTEPIPAPDSYQESPLGGVAPLSGMQSSCPQHLNAAPLPMLTLLEAVMDAEADCKSGKEVSIVKQYESGRTMNFPVIMNPLGVHVYDNDDFIPIKQFLSGFPDTKDRKCWFIRRAGLEVSPENKTFEQKLDDVFGGTV